MLQLVWPDHPKWVAVVVSMTLGWMVVITLTAATRVDRLGRDRRAADQRPPSTPPGRSSTRANGPTRGPASSATTRSSTRWSSPPRAIHYAVVAFVVLPLG